VAQKLGLDRVNREKSLRCLRYLLFKTGCHGRTSQNYSDFAFFLALASETFPGRGPSWGPHFGSMSSLFHVSQMAASCLSFSGFLSARFSFSLMSSLRL